MKIIKKSPLEASASVYNKSECYNVKKTPFVTNELIAIFGSHGGDKISAVVCCLVLRCKSFCTVHEGAGFVRNVNKYLAGYTKSHSTRPNQMDRGN